MALATGVVSAGWLLAVQEPIQVETCVARDPGFARYRKDPPADTPGFEIIDPLRGEVWLTLDWTAEAFDAFSFPGSWFLWQKNDPRRGVADGGRFLRSPGCDAAGSFTYLSAFGREFVQVVELRWPPRVRGGGRVRQIALEKHHVLTFDAGSTVRVLHAPDGERFVLVARTFDGGGEPDLPTGWTISDHTLGGAVTIDLVGEVRVLRLTNEDSYQGPLSAETWAAVNGSRVQ